VFTHQDDYATTFLSAENNRERAWLWGGKFKLQLTSVKEDELAERDQ